ncbi:unnamed protein product, partial [Ectocarpus sp. 12 AP-2014]
AVGKAFLIALAIYTVVATLFAFSLGFDSKSPQALALGAILIFGVAYLLAQGLADKAPWVLTIRTSQYALATALAYFALQTGADWVMAGTLPTTPAPGPLEWALIVLSIVSFGVVAVAQALFPLWAYHPAAAGLRVHLANGLYANAVFDRLIKGSGATPMTQSHLQAADQAVRAIPPVWPLASSVAVNPYLGQSHMSLAETGALLARVSGVVMTMPREWYGEKISKGEITDAD